jgi:hypothetical protein
MNIVKIMGVFMSPVVMIVSGALLVSWSAVVIYSKIFNKNETSVEKKMETVVEHNLENVLNLPSGTLDGKFDFMVQPLEEENGNNKEDKKGDSNDSSKL